MSFLKILVAIDNSPLCQPVFAEAIDLAQSKGAQLMLLHCLSTDVLSETSVPMSVELGLYPQMINPATYETQQVIMEQQIEQALNLLRSYCQTATSQGVPTEFDYKVGDPGQWICQMAQNWGADLIVMGRRGRTGLTEALLGSVSNHVLHHAPCSLLVMQDLKPQETAPVSSGS